MPGFPLCPGWTWEAGLGLAESWRAKLEVFRGLRVGFRVGALLLEFGIGL